MSQNCVFHLSQIAQGLTWQSADCLHAAATPQTHQADGVSGSADQMGQLPGGFPWHSSCELSKMDHLTRKSWTLCQLVCHQSAQCRSPNLETSLLPAAPFACPVPVHVSSSAGLLTSSSASMMIASAIPAGSAKAWLRYEPERVIMPMQLFLSKTRLSVRTLAVKSERKSCSSVACKVRLHSACTAHHCSRSQQ